MLKGYFGLAKLTKLTTVNELRSIETGESDHWTSSEKNYYRVLCTILLENLNKYDLGGICASAKNKVICNIKAVTKCLKSLS